MERIKLEMRAGSELTESQPQVAIFPAWLKAPHVSAKRPGVH
jgi:hypothetical protein